METGRLDTLAVATSRLRGRLDLVAPRRSVGRWPDLAPLTKAAGQGPTALNVTGQPNLAYKTATNQATTKSYRRQGSRQGVAPLDC